MVSSLRLCTLVALFTLAVCSPSALGKALEDRNWLEVRTTNFNIRSLLGEKETIELARRLEMFRAAVAIIANVNISNAPIPTEVYALRRGREFEHFGIDQDTAGVFIAGLRNNTLIIRDIDDIERAPDLLHDYAHSLVGNYTGPHYPKWYIEGVAEYLSVIRGRRDLFDIGLASKQQRDRLDQASWIPINKIIAAEQYYYSWTAESKAAFQAQAWVLVHYLINRPEQDGSLSAVVARYIKAIKSGSDTDTAFAVAFEATARDFNRKLQRYISAADFQFLTFQADTLIPNFKASVIKPGSEQVALGLARVALERGELDSAQHWFTLAATDKQTRPQAESGLGDVAKFRGDFALALPHFEQALALAPNDLYVQLDFAEYWHYRAMNTTQQAEHENFLNNARRQYVKAWKLNDSVAEIYAMYGQTYLLQGNFNRGIEMLEEAGRLLPANLDIRLILAEAYAGAGSKQKAINAARFIVAWSHDSAAIKTARKIVAQFGSRKP